MLHVWLLSLYCLLLTTLKRANASQAAINIEEYDLFETNNATHANETHRFAVATVDWPHVQTPMTIVLWLLLASAAKIGFHASKKIVEYFPDSSLLILLGLLVGFILRFIVGEGGYLLNSNIFFLYLLPPIVFDAGYFMPNRAFFDNLGTILVYAVLGTVWNTLTIGMSLYAMNATGLFSWNTQFLHLMLFASLISAVDPVAVLVVFEEIHVNEILYIVVFGESLLNDAVTVVLYHMFESFAEIGAANILPVDIVAGLISFFVVGLGGVCIGIVWAGITSFTTKYTTNVRVLEPLFVFMFAYCAYLSAELFHLSGILACVFCGICMKQYVSRNITDKSVTTIKYFTKMMSGSCETVIFMFLGLSTVTNDHHFDVGFILLSVFFCLLYRGLGTVLQTYFVNKFRLHKLSNVEQFIMGYGGLRGAIAYGLVAALSADVVPAKQMFVTTTIIVIYVTVFLQGMTIKPLVNWLKVKKKDEHEKSLTEQIFERFMDHNCAAMEHIIGSLGHHRMREKYEKFNTEYLKPLLMRDAPTSRDARLVDVFTRVSIQDALNQLQRYGSVHQIAPYGAMSSLLRTQQSQRSLTEINEATGEVISFPALDMRNVELAVTGKKQESESRLHHLVFENVSWQNARPTRKYSRHTHVDDAAAVESPKPRFQLRYLGKHTPARSKNRTKRKQKKMNGSAVMPKEVSFHVVNEELPPGITQQVSRLSGGSHAYDDYYVSFNAPRPRLQSYDSLAEELTITEREFPWLRSSQNLTPPRLRRASVIEAPMTPDIIPPGSGSLRMAVNPFDYTSTGRCSPSTIFSHYPPSGSISRRSSVVTIPHAASSTVLEAVKEEVPDITEAPFDEIFKPVRKLSHHYHAQYQPPPKVPVARKWSQPAHPGMMHSESEPLRFVPIPMGRRMSYQMLPGESEDIAPAELLTTEKEPTAMEPLTMTPANVEDAKLHHKAKLPRLKLPVARKISRQHGNEMTLEDVSEDDYL